MQTEEAIRQRYSCRAFAKKKISNDAIKTILDAARNAPAAGNIFTVRLILVSDDEKKKQLVNAAFQQDFIAQASHVIVVCSDKRNLEMAYGERAELYARQQAGAAIENMFLKITDMNLGACWIGAFDEQEVKAILNVPDNIDVEALLPVGYAAEKQKLRRKPDLDKITFLEKYGK